MADAERETLERLRLTCRLSVKLPFKQTQQQQQVVRQVSDVGARSTCQLAFAIVVQTTPRGKLAVGLTHLYLTQF